MPRRNSLAWKLLVALFGQRRMATAYFVVVTAAFVICCMGLVRCGGDRPPQSAPNGERSPSTTTIRPTVATAVQQPQPALPAVEPSPKPLESADSPSTPRSSVEEPKRDPGKEEQPEPSYTVRTRKIRTWGLLDLWRAGDKARGERLRVAAEKSLVRRSGSEIYVRLLDDSGRTMILAHVPREDAGPFSDVKGEESGGAVLLEGEVHPGGGTAVTLEHARIASTEDPDEYTEYVPKQQPPAQAATPPIPAATSPSAPSGSEPPKTGSHVAGSHSGSIAAPRGGKTVFVRGYTRKDGTRVQLHWRSAPGTGSSRRR